VGADETVETRAEQVRQIMMTTMGIDEQRASYMANEIYRVATEIPVFPDNVVDDNDPTL
jgi:hypothetical protein